MKKNILFTFDYELFLGEKSGSSEKCLLDPTYRILDILNSFNARGIFFIDTTYLIRLYEQESILAKSDYEQICAQIRKIVSYGHYVFPHIHPHWLDAKYNKETNQWILSNLNNYRFHNISLSQREYLFDKSLSLLDQIITPVHSAYVIDAYRAGGWSIQPFVDYRPHFLKHGIKYDFSVLSGFKSISNAHWYDFTETPKKNIYNFSEDISVENSNGEFTEFAISKINITGIINFLSRVFLKFIPSDQKINGDGISVDLHEIKIKKLLNKNEMVSIELMTRVKLPSYFDFLSNNDYMHFISHPKMISPHSMNCFKKFISESFNKYEINTDFRKMI